MSKANEILKLKEERANLTVEIRKILDEDVNMPTEKLEEIKKMEERADKLNQRIILEERQLERERNQGETEPNNHLNNRNTDKEVEVRNAFDKYLRQGDVVSYNEYRALAQDNPTQAGYLVSPQQFVNELITDLNNVLFFRKMAKVLPPLKQARSLGYPKRVTRMNSFTWGTELSAPTPDTELTFGKREFKPNPGTAEILISKTLLTNAPNTDALVRDEMAYNVSVGLETAYMTGDGSGKPLGIFTASPDGISTARDVSTGNTATEIKFDGLYEAKYKIKQQYHNNLNWIFHRDGVKQIAKIKDGDGQYIWQPSVMAGNPDRLLGLPFNMSEYAPNTFTTGLYVGILGDLSNYWICDSLNMEIQALFELYARTNQVDFITRVETDGAPVVEDAFARVKLG
jgi:HK97 family phage major capsid protein